MALAALRDMLRELRPTIEGSPEQVAASYVDKVGFYSDQDICEASRRFRNGLVKDQHMRFAPTPAEFVCEVRACANRRIENENKFRRAQKQIEARDPLEDRTDESRQRVREMTAAAIAGIAATMRTDEAEAAKRKAEQEEKVRSRFDPPREGMVQRLSIINIEKADK